MIQFNKIALTPYDKALLIDIEVPDSTYLTNVYLDKIVIGTQDTFNTTGISSDKAVYTYTFDGNLKSASLTIPTVNINTTIDGNILFLYIYVKGTPSSDAPCGMDTVLSIGAVVDMYSVYKKAMYYLNELYSNCKIPKEFINFVLRFKAFEICFKTRDYVLAILYWNEFYKSLSSNTLIYNCSCHG